MFRKTKKKEEKIIIQNASVTVSTECKMQKQAKKSSKEVQ